MFNFFSKSDTPKENNNVLASITYFIEKDSDHAIIDVALSDYDDESVEGLCSLLNILGEDMFYIDTINMIKDSLKAEGEEQILAKVFASIDLQLRKKIIGSAKERLKNEPYIKPSEMFK